jgi:prepilin-type N-terminal cleavage/methylation domain-containing protein
MRRRGFTLLEVLLALGLIAMLAAGVMGFLWGLLDRREWMSRVLTDAQAGAALMERLETDILCGVTGGPGGDAGVVGTTTTVKVLTRGVALPLDAAGATGPAAGDLQGSEYAFDRSGGTLRARRWMAGSSGSGEFELISDHIQALRLSYFDGDSWRSSFDSGAEGGLPVAIEVALWFGEPLPDEDGGAPEPEPVVSEGGEPGAPVEPAGPLARAEDKPPPRTPDRLRVIVVPDGPVSSWKESR